MRLEHVVVEQLPLDHDVGAIHERVRNDAVIANGQRARPVVHHEGDVLSAGLAYDTPLGDLAVDAEPPLCAIRALEVFRHAEVVDELPGLAMPAQIKSAMEAASPQPITMNLMRPLSTVCSTSRWKRPTLL